MRHRNSLDRRILCVLEGDPTTSFRASDIAAQVDAQAHEVASRLRILAVDACVQRLPEDRFMALVGRR